MYINKWSYENKKVSKPPHLNIVTQQAFLLKLENRKNLTQLKAI